MRNGYFVDAGAYDGIWANNTYALETALGWRGLCIEANPSAFVSLTRHRQCECINVCLDETPGNVEFALDGVLGGIVSDETDNRPAVRHERLERLASEARILTLEAVPLGDLLDRHAAPAVIEYLSVDLEGAETRVLRSFPFDRYTFLAMTIERPTPELNRLLIEDNGYRFVRNVRYDTYYVHESFDGIERLRVEPFEQVPPKDW